MPLPVSFMLRLLVPLLTAAATFAYAAGLTGRINHAVDILDRMERRMPPYDGPVTWQDVEVRVRAQRTDDRQLRTAVLLLGGLGSLGLFGAAVHFQRRGDPGGRVAGNTGDRGDGSR